MRWVWRAICWRRGHDVWIDYCFRCGKYLPQPRLPINQVAPTYPQRKDSP